MTPQPHFRFASYPAGPGDDLNDYLKSGELTIYHNGERYFYTWQNWDDTERAEMLSSPGYIDSLLMGWKIHESLFNDDDREPFDVHNYPYGTTPQ